MIESPRISVTCIIPTHDRPRLLEESIASVLSQETCHSFEVFVIDDLGNDSTKEVAYRAARESSRAVHYVHRHGPSGASASRNLALSVASGEFVAFLDDDDLWSERFLEEMVNALQGTEADMAVAWLNVLELDGTVRPLYRMPRSISIADVAARNVGFTGSNFLIKRTAFASLGGFDSDLPVSNDKDFFLRFLLAGYEYIVTPLYLATHRRHDGPQLTAGNERRAAGIERYFRKHENVLTWSGRRHLRKKIHRIRLVTSPNRTARVLHSLGFVANLTLADLRSKWRRRDGRYSDL